MRGVFLGGSSAGASAMPSLPNLAMAAPGAAAPQLAEAAQGDQAAKRAFMAQASSQRTVSVERLTAPASPNIVQAGSIVPAALITGIRSDLPGQITAQVTANVYDSPTGRILLIPQGARLIGEYDSEIAAGQTRVLLAWDRLIMPDGRSIVLERQPGADAAGYAGLQDRVNQHWGNLLKAAAVSTLLGVGAELGADSEDDLTRALRRGSQDTINQTGQQIVRRQLNVQPTLTIRPGHPLRVVLMRSRVASACASGIATRMRSLQGAAHQPRMGRLADHDRDVEQPALDAGQQHIAVAFEPAQLHLGMAPTELAQRGPQVAGREGGVEAHRQLAGMAVGRGADPGVQLVPLLHDPLGDPQIGRPVRRQGGAARLAVEQRHAQPLLGFEDVTAQRRLLDVEVARRSAEAARLSRRDQVAELAQLDHRRHPLLDIVSGL